MEAFVQNNLQSIAWYRPELALTFGALALFLLDLVWRRSPARRALLAASTLGVFGLAAAFLAMQPQESTSLFNGLVASDAFAIFFKWLFLAAGSLTVLIAIQGDEFPEARLGEFVSLLVSIVLGLFVMASATNLLTIYLGIELVSMVSYVLAGYRKGDEKATEASLKYVIYGGVASGTMLFGMSWLYGMLGTTNVLELAPRLAEAAVRVQAIGPASLAAGRLAFIVSLVFITAGIGYKIASVPWHMWCPDVYEGAPTPFTGFLSVAPKAAGFAVALRLFYGAFGTLPGADGFSHAVADIPWPAIFGVLSAITMTLGNLTALSQTNLKRMLAYSSIAHAGYTLMGLAAVSVIGTQGVLLYMLVYLVMNLGAFLAIIVVAQATGSETIHDCRGLAHRSPLAAVAFAIFLFSLTGLPPFAGFTAKWYLFYAVVERMAGPGGGWYFVLALIGALNTAVALFYYARIIRLLFLEAPTTETAIQPRWGQAALLGAFSVLLLVFGVWWNPIVAWSQHALTMLRA